MPISETWLLPDGVADVLPEQAQVIETLRRQALDFLATRGYQLVYTPFIEYIESLSSLSESIILTHPSALHRLEKFI
jgi:ATP phosphoribosyltransferase regulatory subunit